MEIKHLLQEGRHAIDVLDRQEDVVDAWRRDAHQPEGLGWRIGERQQVAHLLHTVDEFHLVTGGRLETGHRAASDSDVGTIQALDGHTCILKSSGVMVKILEVLHLPAHVRQAVGRGIGQDHGVVLMLVPALQVDALRFTRRLDHAEDFGVIGNR